MYRKEKQELIFWAEKLYRKGFVLGTAGNISLKINKRKILITSHNSYLGYLRSVDLLVLDIKGNILQGNRQPTFETRLHLGIHKNFKERVVLHAHPPFTYFYFCRLNKLKNASFESRVYLGKFKVIPQKTPNVLNAGPIIRGLKASKIAVLKNHGVVSIGDDFKEALSLIEILEKESKLNVISGCIHE